MGTKNKTHVKIARKKIPKIEIVQNAARRCHLVHH